MTAYPDLLKKVAFCMSKFFMKLILPFSALIPFKY